MSILSRNVLAENVLVSSVPSAGGRLHGVHVVRPPGASSPPQSTDPDIRVLDHVVQHARDGGLALVIVAAGELTDDTNLVVLTEPGGSRGDTLLADGRGHALS